MDASQLQLAPGHIVAGRYRLEESLGRGGFGAVFRATELRLDRQVALKVLLPEIVHREDALERFRREFTLAKQLSHPNTVRLYDFGRGDDGLPYIAWELLQGRDLQKTLRSDGPMAPRRVAHVGSQVLKSLMEAHGLGIVHRDIKPSNILLCDFSGEPDFVKVLDFGIARASLGDEAQQNLTQAGTSPGTPSYMPPEQVLGDRVDARADLYALGLVLAEALTARLVVHADTPMKICMLQASSEPVVLAPEVVSSPLGHVIVRATRKSRDERYPDAAAMLADLDRTAAACGDVPIAVAGLSLAHAATLAGPVGAASLAHASTEISSPPLTSGSHTVPPHVVGHSGEVATAAAGRSKSLVAVAVVGVVIGLGGLAAGLHFGGVLGSAATPAASGMASSPLPVGPAVSAAKAPAELASVRIHGSTAQQILDRLASRGWKATRTDLKQTGAIAIFNYIVFHSESLGGSLQFHVYPNAKDAALAAGVYGGYGHAVHDDRTVLYVSVRGDAALSQALVDQLLE